MRNRFLPSPRLGAAVAILLLTAGCVQQQYVNLWYDPVARASGTRGRKLIVVKFTDTRARTDPTNIGEIQNQYGVKVGQVRVSSDQDVGAWVANALIKELTRAGYVVERYRDAAPPDADIFVYGTVPEVFAYPQVTGGLRAVVVSNVAVTRAGGVILLNKPYMGVSTTGRGGCFTSKMDSYASFFDIALQQMMRKLTPDIITAVEGR